MYEYDVMFTPVQLSVFFIRSYNLQIILYKYISIIVIHDIEHTESTIHESARNILILFDLEYDLYRQDIAYCNVIIINDIGNITLFLCADFSFCCNI